MIIVMKRSATEQNIDKITTRLDNAGFKIHLSKGVERTIIGAVGDKTRVTEMAVEAMEGVEKVIPILKQYKLACRDFKQEDTVIEVGGQKIGGSNLQVMAGPCAVENRDQIMEIAEAVKEAGANFLRGGAFKPRTSPYSFQGLQEEGLKMLAEARDKTGLLIISEVMDVETIPLVSHYVDILQVGARNMQNFTLLKELAKIDKPVMIKRGPSATFEEWIMAAEYIMAGGNNHVILCERGVRTFETYTRNTLDLTAVPVIKELTHLPIIVDPSHGTGKWNLVEPMSKAAVACGTDGLMIEVHNNPSEAMSDGPQSLTPDRFHHLMDELARLAPAMGREI